MQHYIGVTVLCAWWAIDMALQHLVLLATYEAKI